MTITPRTLSPLEVQRAIDAGGPLQEMGIDPARLAAMTVAVVEVDGQIAAYWVAWKALHLEPLWIHPTWRKHPGVVGGIVEQIQQVAADSGEPVAFCEIATEDQAAVVPYATRLGFQAAPGQLYYVVLAPPTPDGKVN